jgi:hypothetical protein
MKVEGLASADAAEQSATANQKCTFPSRPPAHAESALRFHHRVAFDVLACALTRCEVDGITGALHVAGNPGGTFHLRSGAVVAVESPGAPRADALLLRTGRISEGDWTDALRIGAEARTHQAELVARGNVGPTELHVISMMAAQDAAFSIAAGSIREYAVDGRCVDVLLPMTPGVNAEWLLDQTARRLDALASLSVPVSPHLERVAPVHGVLPTDARTAIRQEILANATGRRSARDIAFMVGRSVYSIAVEISRMLDEGLMEVVPGISTTPSAVRRTAVLRTRSEIGPANRVDDEPTVLLPRRQRAEGDIADCVTEPKPAARHAFSRFLSRTRVFSSQERKSVEP